MIEYESDIVPFFSKAIYSKVTNIATEEIVPLLDSFDYRKSGMQDITDLNDTNNLSLSSISNKVLENEKLKPLKERLMKEFYLYAEGEMKYINKFQITTSWLTKTHKGETSNLHRHHNSFISGLLYLTADDNCGDIIFQQVGDMNSFHLQVSEHNLFNAKSWRFKPKNGLLIFFPSEIHHKIAKSNSDLVRRSLAFNLMPIGLLGDVESDSTVTVDSW